MALTRFQALVSRESGAVVFDNSLAVSQDCVVTAIRETSGTWLAEIEYNDGDRRYAVPGDLTPSRHLLSLIERGTYDESTMTHKGYGGKVTSLSY